MGILDWMFPNPADKANKSLDQIPGQIKPYYEPYFNAGTGALGDVNKEYGNLLSDPNSIIARLGAGYQKSPGYDWRLNQGENAITNAAAAGGMAGTGQHQQQAGELAGNLANQDYQSYLDKVLGLYGMGLQGKQGIAGMGQNAGESLGTSIANVLGSQSQNQFAGGVQQNSIFSNLLNSIISAGASKNKPFWMQG